MSTELPTAPSAKITKPSVVKTALMLISLMMLGACGGFFFGKMAKENAAIKLAISHLVWWDGLVFVLLFVLVLAVHEMGHLLGGFYRGMRFLLFVVGPFQWRRTVDGIKFQWVFRLGGFLGLAAATPDPKKDFLLQMKSMVLGGPFASASLAALVFLLSAFAEGRVAVYAMFTAVFSMFIFFITLIPFRSGGFMSDGMQWLEMRRGGPEVKERQLITNILMQSIAGVRPRDLDATNIAQCLALQSTDPMRAALAHSTAFLAAIDANKIDIAKTHAAWLTENINAFPQGFRQSVMIELSVFSAKLGELENARSWLQKSSGGLVDEARRVMAEFEIALLEKNRGNAERALEKARRHSTRALDAGLNVMTLEQIKLGESRLLESIS